MLIVLISQAQQHGLISFIRAHYLLARFWMFSLDSLLLWFVVHFSHKSLKSVRRKFFCCAVLLWKLLEKVLSRILLKWFVMLDIWLVNWWTDSKLRRFSWNRHCHLASNNPLISVGVNLHGWLSNIVWLVNVAYLALISWRSLLMLIHSVIVLSWVLLVAMLRRAATWIKPVTLLITSIGKKVIILFACSALAEGG